ncbi:MAG: hypothetical protein ABIQ08_13170 [Duganella sp.]
MADGKRYLEISRDGGYTRLKRWAGNAIWLRSSWGMDGETTFAVSWDGRRYAPLLVDFPLTRRACRGSRVGLLTFNLVAGPGYVDVDAVSYAIDAGTASR